jgi:hypothetical protein
MKCILAEADRLYGAHGIPFFTLSCSMVAGKKHAVFPTEWQRRLPAEMRYRNKNAVCVRAGSGLVVVDADGADAIEVVQRLLARTGVDARTVPQVQTQRGPSGRHFYFAAAEGTPAYTLKNSVKLVIDGVETNVDIRAGYNGNGVGCVLAPPTVVKGGGAYTLLDGPAIHEAPPMPDALVKALHQSTTPPKKRSSVPSA